MPDLSELLNNLPIDSIASKLGVNKDQASQAIELALPALLGGMNANVQDEAGAQSLSKALTSHKGKDVKKISATDVDTADGEKIVKNIFGNNTDKVVNVLGAQGSGGGVSDLIPQLLPMLAPMVMAFLANQFSGNDNKTNNQTSGGGNMIGDLLGGLLGGGNNNSSSGGGLMDMVGGLFGGDNKSNGSKASNDGGNMIGDLLGGLFGGGKR